MVSHMQVLATHFHLYIILYTWIKLFPSNVTAVVPGLSLTFWIYRQVKSRLAVAGKALFSSSEAVTNNFLHPRASIPDDPAAEV